MFVGDNIMDFPALTQDLRKQPANAFARFGEDFILLPNSMYGSWEKNLDDNAI
jgi:predicted secreted acid phosphatase